VSEHEIAPQRRTEDGGIVGQAARHSTGRQRCQQACDQIGLTHVSQARAGDGSRAALAPRDRIEQAVDERRLAAVVEGVRDIHVFVDHRRR